MMQHRSWVLALALLGTACGGQSDALDEPFELTGTPVALDEQLLMISAKARAGYLLDVTGPRPSGAAKRVELPFGALSVQRRSQHDEALVVCVGRRDSAEAEAEPAALAVVGSDASVRSYTLGATPFDTLVQSNDGRYAVLYRGKDRPGRTLQNVNELVVIDLDKDPSDDGAVTSKTPEGLAHAFESALVSPEPLPIAGEMRRLLVLLSAAEITLFDLNHLDRRGTIVELASSAGMPQPKQVLFGKNEPVLYVRGDNADDVYMFRLEARNAAPPLNDFRPTLNPLGAGKGPRDMVLFGDETDPQVFVVGLSSEARSIDPRSGKTQVVPLPGPGQHVYKFLGGSPTDDQERWRALVYGEGSKTLMFVDLDGARERPDRALETLTLTEDVKSVIEIPKQPNKLILTHAQGITSLDLEQRTATPIAADGALDGATFDPQTERLWVATKNTQWVGTLDLTSGETGEVRLDADVQTLVPFFEAGKLAVVHSSRIGHVTLIDTSEPDREHARSVRGFIVAGIADRGE
jgi:hypothetical protein